MTAAERLRKLAEVLPSDRSAVTFTRADLLALAADEKPDSPTRDMTVEDVAAETGRAPSTVRTWLIGGDLQGYKLRGRDWRVTRGALSAFLDGEGRAAPAELRAPTDGDDTPEDSTWRRRLRSAS